MQADRPLGDLHSPSPALDIDISHRDRRIILDKDRTWRRAADPYVCVKYVSMTASVAAKAIVAGTCNAPAILSPSTVPSTA